jgi:hypothetical protein
MMLKRFLARQIDRFERQWRYDGAYMRRLLEDGGTAPFVKFWIATSMVDRKAAPPEALAAAGIVGTMYEDCGPCTQISVDMAAAGGVSETVLHAILAGDEAAMGEDAALAYRFARASLARDVEAADPLRDEVVRCWGDRALVALGLAITTARMYPTLKYALGYGKACSRVTVSGEPARIAHLAAAA